MSKCAPKGLKVFKDFVNLAGDEMIAEIVWNHLDGNVDNLTTIEQVYEVLKEASTSLVSEIEEVSKMRDTISTKPLAKFTKEQRNEIVDSLIFLSVWDGDKQQIVNLEKGLSLNNLKGILTNLRNSPEHEIYRDNFDEILKDDNLNALKIEMGRKLFQLGASIDPDENPDDKNSGGGFSDSFLINNLDKARASTKLMIGFLVEEGKGNVLGIKKFNNFNKSWNDIESIFTNIPYDENTSDKYKTFIEKLKDEVAIKPQYEFLIQLLENADEQTKTQFLRSLDNFKIEYVSEIIRDTKNKMGNTTDMISSESSSNVSKLINQWDAAYIKSFLDNNKNKPQVLKNRAAKIVTNYDKIKSEVNNRDEVTQELLDWTITLLGSVGIPVTNKSLNAYLATIPKSKIDSLKELYSSNGLEYIFKGGLNSVDKLADNKLRISKSNDIKSPMLDEKNVRTLAETLVRFENSLIGNATFGPDGKMYQTVAQYDYMGKTIVDITNGNKYLDDLNNEYTKNSVFIDYLKDPKNKKKLKLTYFLSRREEGRDGGVDMNGMSEIDETVSRIERVLDGQLPYFTLADKNRVYYLNGLPTEKYVTNTLKKETILKFVGYLADELNTMRKAWEEVYGTDEQRLPVEKQVLNYHYKINKITGEKDYSKGNAFTISMMPSLNPGSELANELGLYNSSENNKPFPIAGTYITEDEDGNVKVEPGFVDLVYDSVKNNLMSRIDEATSKMMDKLITIENGKVTYTSFTEATYDKYIKRYAEVKDQNNFNPEQGVRTIATNYIINTLTANIEYTKLFTGDPRMYKTLEDFLKRVPATSATGDYLRIVEGKVNENFKIAIAPNINFKSSLLDKESIDNIIEFVGAETTKEKDEIKNLLKPYSNVNRTDAQAWITLDRFKEIQIGLGEWNEDLDKAFDRIKDGKKKASAKDYALFSEKMTTMQPKKGVHFELVTDSKNNKIPVYLKYSQAILFPEFISSSYQLTRIAEQMEAQGVSELIVGDGVKVGAIEPTDLGSNRTDLIKFNTITLSNKNWKLQQDLPSKGNKDTLVGSQIKKNVIANINPTSDYNGISGEDLIKAIHTMDGELSNRGLKKVLKKLNVKDGKVDNDALYEMLISEFKDDGESANLLDALKNRVPIDNILSHRQVIWNKISALWNKSTVKIKQPGGAAIQLSDYGFESGEDMVKFENIKNKDKNGIIWLTNDRKLKPPRIVKDAEGNVTMSAGQCLLPYNTIAKSFGKEWDTVKNLPMNELIKKIDKNALKMVGYRIPNQEIASNDSLEIVGILPPHAGDTIVLYSEITTKTGSDFDIDKMYYILPPLKLVNGRVEAVKYLDESNSTIEERYSEYKKELIKRKDIVEELAKEGLNLREVRKLLREFGRKGVSLKMREANLSILLTDEEVDSIIDDILLGSESMMTIEDFGKLSIDEQNTEEALQSRRIDLYRKVLESKHTYKRLITSVDAEWLKDQIRVMLPKQDLSDMELFDGYYQMGIRREFITSKGGVGQVANHQGDNAISQWQEAYLVDSSGRLDIGNLTSEGNLDLSKATSKNFEVLNIKGDKFEIVDNLQDEQYISSSISAYMNAFVDAAKDNYIGAANFNFLTNNPAFLLIRNGVSPQYVNAFMAQPVIRRYVELINKTEGQAVERNTKKPIDLIHEELGLTKEEINDLEEVKLSNYSTSQLMNIVIDDSNNKPIDNKDQAKLLNLFLHVQDLSKTLRDSGMASKADTEAGGKSIGEAYIKRNLKINVSNIHNGNQLTVGNWDEKFNKDGIKTMLGSYHDNSIESIISHVGPLSLLGTNNMQYLLNHSFIELTGEYPKDGDRYNKIYQLSYAALLSELDVFNKGISNKNNDGIQDIMTGDNSVSNRVYKLKSNPLYDNNTLIDMLLTKEGRFGSMDYVYLDNSKSRDKNVNEQITEDWLELYESDNPEDVKLAKDLVLYAYHTSALTDNISSIYRLMPYQIPLDLGLSINSFNQLKYKLNDESTKLNTFTKVFEQVMLNSWDDTSIVPKVSKKNTLKVGDFTSEVDKTIVFAVNEISSPTLKIGNDEKGNLIFKPYVSRDEYIMNPITFNTTKHTRLYKYIGNTEQGDIQAGVYKRVSKLGDRNGRHKLFEFTLGEAKESIVKGNNYKMDKNSISKLNSIVIERPNTIFNTQENITESLPESEIISTIAELDIPSMSEMEEILKELDNGCKTKGKK